MTLVAVAVFVTAYALIASEKIHRVTVALGGAAVMLAAGVLDFEHAFHSEETGVDWEVIFLLLGMMIIVGVLRQTGVFEYVAIRAVKRAGGGPFRVMVLLVLITAGASALLDNVTTVLLIAPVTLLVCNRIGVNPVPFLLAEVFASNVGGTATLIGDPPNIIIAGRAGLTFNDFLIHLAPIVVVLVGALLLLCRVMFRDQFAYDPEGAAEVMALDEREAISDPRLLIKSGVVLIAVLVGFVVSATTGTAPATVALLGAGVLVLISGLQPREYLADVEAPTLLFFVGLFIMVGALIEVGAIGQLAEWATEATGGDVQVATFLLLSVSAVLSAVVDNIPYVATMAPLVESLAGSTGNPDNVLWWSLALGADLGGNATIIGASANVVMLGIAEKNGYRITFWHFAKYGSIVTLVTVLLCVPYLYLRYFAFA
ncbi:MAG: ArsB/NhaD family transporter [Actinomycetota bacterium]|nr:ArsB/NhaD family transporter [Actinomycetota bacterium]